MKDRLTNRYNNDFAKEVDYLLKLGKKKADREVKIFYAPMGFGKTHNLITNWIPYLFQKTDLQVIVITAPMSDIVADNVKKLKKAGMKNGFIATTDVAEAIEFMEDGDKVVLYVTNKMLFATDSDMPNIFKTKLVDTKFAIINDEFHAHTTSSSENYKEVLGHSGGKFKATMYRTLKDFSPFTNYLFGVTATPNIEVKGEIETDGNLNYRLVNADSKILPHELRDRSAWMGQVFWRTSIPKLIDRAIEDAEYVEQSTGYKRVTMIVSEQNKSTDSWTIDDTLDYIRPKIDEDKDTYTIAVTSTKGCYLYSKSGSKIKSDDASILKRANDLNDPLKYILVVDKFRMGINCATMKALVMLKKSDSKRPDGSPVIENALQTLGRLLRPFGGVDTTEFWNKYGGKLSKCPSFPKEINQMNYYMMDTPMWRAAMAEFEDYIAPNYVEEEVCPCCNGTGKKFKKDIEEATNLNASSIDGINNALNTDFAGHLYVKN